MSKLRGIVQGFAAGAALMAAMMLAVPPVAAQIESTIPETDLQTIADEFGVKIVWSVAPCNLNLERLVGCAQPHNPEVIYVSPDQSDDMKRHTVLHEIGHILQYRLGVKSDECGADRFAQAMGSRIGAYCPVVS